MTKRTPRTAREFLAEAQRIVRARAATHGSPLENHANIGELWNAYLKIRRHAGKPLTPADVAEMMKLVKTARRQLGAYNPDDDLDDIGYGAVVAEIRAKGGDQ